MMCCCRDSFAYAHAKIKPEFSYLARNQAPHKTRLPTKRDQQTKYQQARHGLCGSDSLLRPCIKVTPPDIPPPARVTTMDLNKNNQSPSDSSHENAFHEELLPDNAAASDVKAEGSEPMTWHTLLTKIRRLLLLDKAEKIALLSIGIIFIALALWAVIWLIQKNQLTEGTISLNLPVKGAHATISDLASYWKLTDDMTGVKMGAIVVPAATITLDKRSTSGALRIYFLDANKQHMGDPVTIIFRDGLFGNNSNKAEISASDGFHSRVDFDSYQLGSTGAWSLEVLEAKGELEPRSNFSVLLTAEISPSLR